MSSFKGARASAWELLPATIVMGLLLGVLAYSKKPIDYLAAGRPRRYAQYHDFNLLLNARDASQAQARFREKCEKKLENKRRITLT